MPLRITFLSLPAELRQQILLNLLSEDDLRRMWRILRWEVRPSDELATLRHILHHTCLIPEVSADMAYCVEKWVKWVAEHAIAKTNPERKERLRKLALETVDRDPIGFTLPREVYRADPFIEMTPTIAFENHCAWLRRLYEHDQLLETLRQRHQTHT